jgi:hypothetical protein
MVTPQAAHISGALAKYEGSYVMPSSKQYYDSLEVKDGYIWAVDDIEGTKTPLEVHAVGYSGSLLEPTEIEIQQPTGGWWYSRKKFSAKEAKEYSDKINGAINILASERLKL